MAHPANVLKALPGQAGPSSLPQSLLDTLPAGAAMLRALPVAGEPANITAALPEQGVHHLPTNTLDALPTDYPIPQVARPVSDVLAQLPWSGWDGAAPVAFPNIWTTFDEAYPFNLADYAQAPLDLLSFGVYTFMLTPRSAPVSGEGLLELYVERTAHTTGPYKLIIEITNVPGATFVAREITAADFTASPAAYWSFVLTAAEVAAITTPATMKGSLSLSGGPAGIDPGAIHIMGFQLTIPHA
jgi:hypothetical protein